jgi:hypothetical protein
VKLFTAILFIAFATFIFKPVAGTMRMADKMECGKKSACEKHRDGPAKKDCGNNGCNMLSCALCSYYMPISAEINIVIVPGMKDEFISFNDHRLYFTSSDCWHPPKQAMFYTA